MVARTIPQPVSVRAPTTTAPQSAALTAMAVTSRQLKGSLSNALPARVTGAVDAFLTEALKTSSRWSATMPDPSCATTMASDATLGW